MINTCGYFLKTVANASSSSLLYTDPEGLQGDENRKTFDLSVIASSSSAAEILNLFSIVVLRITGTPLAIFTSSEYVTQNGAGMITSSPSSTNAKMMLAILCLAPVEITIFSGL